MTDGPLSHGQRALWFLHGLAPEGGAYNIAAAFRLLTPVDPDAFERTFQALVDRHPALRTTFSAAEGEVRQRTAPAVRFTLAREDVAGQDEARLRARLAEAAFGLVDLERGPLFRVTLFSGDGGEQIALLVVHHIVADFWSLAVLARELPVLYRQEATGEPASLPPPGLPYEEHVRRELEALDGPRGEASWRFWQETLEELPALELMTDRPRPAIQTYRGDLRTRLLPAALAADLKALSRRRGATFFMTLTAALQTLLLRHTGQVDLAIGSPTAGRHGSAFAGTVGYFVNPVVLRGDLSGDPPFSELLARTHRAVVAAFEHQDYPLPLLAERLRPQRDASRTPLFQVSLVLQKEQRGARGLAAFVLGQEGVPIELGAILAESVRLDRPPTPFDLQLHVAETVGGLGLGLQLNTDLFDVTTSERLIERFEVLLRGLVANPDASISALPVLTEADRHQLLQGWNDIAGGGSESTLWELFAAQAARTPGAVAVVFEGARLTYAELSRCAAALAGQLTALGVGQEVVVGVCEERSLELVVGLLAVLAAGGAYLPLEPSLPCERLAVLLADACPAVVLTRRSRHAELPPVERIVFLDGTAEPPPTVEPPPSRVLADNAAYLIYTSGSTGRPKGVVNRHRGIVNRLLWMQEALSLGADDRVLQKTPFGFDVSVWEFFAPLVTGARLVVSRPGGHQDPAYLAELVAREGVTMIHFVPSMLPVFLAEPGVAAACSTVRRVIVSGEALPFEVEQRCLATLPAPLFNLYGPTEAAVEVTAWRCRPAPSPRPVPIGRPIRNTRIHLLDPTFRPVPPGAPGELAIGGVQVARGYLGRPDLTAERFVPDPFSSELGARLYRTGDLARHLAQGEVEFLGRIDHQVKVRGFRIEPQEIELHLASHPGVAEAVVVVRTGSLLACLVPRGSSTPDLASLREHLAARLPAYMVPAGFAILDHLPRLSSGKVDRRTLANLAPTPIAEGGGRAPRTPVEEILAGLFAEVLEVDRVGVEDGFFDLGGHSLSAMRLAARVREALGIELPVRTIFETPTVEGLAASLEGQQRPDADQVPLVPVPRDGPLPLSFAQQRLWFLDQLEPGSPAYHMPAAVRLTGALDRAALAAAFSEVVRRHEALRTTFRKTARGPVQVVAANAGVPLPLVDLRGLPATQRTAEAERLSAAEARRPFDLERGPLLRAVLLATEAEEHTLLVNLHHIVSDGWSLGVLVRELGAFYGASSPLPALPVQYADYAVWQRSRLAGAFLDAELAWWRGRLQGLPPALDLPTDHPRPAARSVRGAIHGFSIDGAASAALASLSRRHGSTLFMTLLAGFAALLSRHSGQEDLAVGTPIAGRTRVETEPLIGLFVNTLALRVDLAGDPTVAELLSRVRETTLAAYAHQELPFERLVEELVPERDLSRPPLLQVMLVLQNAPAGPLQLPGLALSAAQVDTGTAKLELTLTLTETERGLAGGLEYSLDLFEEATAARLAERLVRLLGAAADDPRRRVSELPLLSVTERRQILVAWNDVGTLPAADCALHQLFEAQAARTPDATALIAGVSGQRWTYAELDAWAEGLASRLVRSGVGPEVRVGVCLTRTPLLVASLLAVLKAGGAYVPLDPEYPRERLAFLLEDSRAAVVVTEPGLVERLPETMAELIVLEPAAEAGGALGPHPLTPSPIAPPSTGRGGKGALPGNLAYLIYTSGSTGRPKGVAITHRSAVAFACWARTVFSEEDLAGVLASTSVSFDLSVFELFITLAWGGTVILAANALELPRLAATDEVTLVNTVPSAIAELVREGRVPATVRTINLAGEPLSRSLADAIYDALPGVRVLDLYGPSEATTYSTWAPARREDRHEPTIGRAIAGNRAVLLGRQGEPVPAGVAGELLLGGAGLARGYLERPDLTAERFVPDPIAPDEGGEPGGRLYRTGDLARWRPDGQLEYLGRIDHQVKVRGFRIELGEIEAALRLHPAISEAAVVARPDKASLLAAVVADGTPSATELRSFLRERLPEHMVPSAWAFLAEMPLTANGKVDRKVLTRLQPGREAPVAATKPRTPGEELMAGLFAEVLDVNSIGIDDDFFAHGGHSLLATQLVARARTVFGVELPVRAVFEQPTVAGLARLVERSARGDGETIERISRDEPLLLSFAQQRLWFLEQMEPGSAAYHIPAAVRLRGRLDRQALAAALSEVERRHEALRTTFRNVAGAPVQVVSSGAATALPLVDLHGLPAALRDAEAERLSAAEARRPFDLTTGPLWRTTLLALGTDEHLTLVTLHHIVSDGWSLGVLVRELGALYAGASLAGLPVQYADWAAWQRRRLSGPYLKAELDWWRGALDGLPLALDLPTDRPRPKALGSRGAVHGFALDARTTGNLNLLALRHRTTLFMTLLAGFATLLARHAGQDDLAVGTPIAGRTRVESEPLVGLFVNTLPLRVGLSGNPEIADLLARVRETTLAAYAHQEVPFERLIEELVPERDLSRPPLVQTMLVLQNAPGGPPALSGLELETRALPTGTAKLELTWTLTETVQGLDGTIEYNCDLFDEAIIGRLARRFQKILGALAADPRQRLSQLPLLEEGEQEQVRTAPPRTPARTPAEEMLLGIFSEVLEASDLGVDDDFFARGGHSIHATRVAARVRAALGVDLPLRALFKRPTVRTLAASIRRAARGREGAIERIPRDAPLPLSFAQERLWLLEQTEPGSAAYNIPAAVRLRGRLDRVAFAAALAEVERRHEVLRTNFQAPLQVIDLSGLPELERVTEADRLALAEARRPFDLAARPPWRATLLALGPEEHLALVTLHRIVGDGWSLSVLARDLQALYTGASLAELPIQYADYAAWQRKRLSGAFLETELAWWRDALTGLPPALSLSTDRPRPKVPGSRGAAFDFAIDAETTAGLARLAGQHGATLFMALLAGFAALLFLHSGQDDLAVGTLIAGRTRVETEPLIGPFANMLPLRIDLSGDPEVADLLVRVRETTLAAFAHQEVPFERLIEELVPEHDLSRPSLVQTLLVLQNAPAGPLVLPGFELETASIPTSTATFEMTWTLSETAQGLAGTIEYNRDLFDATTIARLARYFQRILAAAAADPRQRLSQLPRTTSTESAHPGDTDREIVVLSEHAGRTSLCR